MSDKQLAVIKPETITRLDEIANTYQLAKIDKSPFAATFSTALAINELRSVLTAEVMRPIMDLMNTPLGFLTDRSGKPNRQGIITKQPYTWEEVRDVVIEATLRGFFPVGNELNIIAGRFYAAKNGLRRKVTTHPGITEFRDSYSIPKTINNAGAIVEAEASWKLNGTSDSLKRNFAVKGDEYAAADSYIGKATRKLLAAVWERISGVAIPEGEVEEVNLSSMKQAEGCEVESPEMERWRMDCQATEEYNARLRAQGAPESDMEPMPMPPGTDEIPGLPREPKPQPPVEIPWREVEVTHAQLKALAGKKLGELAPEMLEKIRDTINKMSAPVRAGKPGIDALLTAVSRGLKELSDAPKEPPAKATPLEGLLNLMRADGITESAVLDLVRENHGEAPESVALLGKEIISALHTAWPDIADQLREASK